MRNNDKGTTLLAVLILSAVALIISAGMIYLVMAGTKISGAGKKYKTALEAGRAGVDVMCQVLEARQNPHLTFANFQVPDDARLATKITFPTEGWPAGTDRSITIDQSNTNTYDVTFDLGGYNVFAKIIDTVTGNTSEGGGGGGTGGTARKLHKRGVVENAGDGEVTAAPYPYLYSVEILAVNTKNPSERSKLNFLYEY